MEKIVAVNGSDRDWTDHRYILCFGAYGWTRLMVWANSLEDALDESVDWIVENAPGLLCNEEVYAEYNRLVAEGKSVEEAMEEATVDTTCAGNCGDYLLSYEWGIVAEDPTREEIKDLERA